MVNPVRRIDSWASFASTDTTSSADSSKQSPCGTPPVQEEEYEVNKNKEEVKECKDQIAQQENRSPPLNTQSIQAQLQPQEQIEKKQENIKKFPENHTVDHIAIDIKDDETEEPSSSPSFLRKNIRTIALVTCEVGLLALSSQCFFSEQIDSPMKELSGIALVLVPQSLSYLGEIKLKRCGDNEYTKGLKTFLRCVHKPLTEPLSKAGCKKKTSD